LKDSDILIRRWRIAKNVIPGIVYGMTYSDDGNLTTVPLPLFEKSFNIDQYYLWPIPQRDIDLSGQLTQKSELVEDQ